LLFLMFTKVLVCQTSDNEFINIYPMLGEIGTGNVVNLNYINKNPCFNLIYERKTYEVLHNTSSNYISINSTEFSNLEQFKIIRFTFSYLPCINLSNSSKSETNCLDNEHIEIVKNIKSESKIFFVIEVLNSKTSEIKSIYFNIKLE